MTIASIEIFYHRSAPIDPAATPHHSRYACHRPLRCVASDSLSLNRLKHRTCRFPISKASVGEAVDPSVQLTSSIFVMSWSLEGKVHGDGLYPCNASTRRRSVGFAYWLEKEGNVLEERQYAIGERICSRPNCMSRMLLPVRY
jgi:hypothetical protein